MSSPTELRQAISQTIIDALTNDEMPPWRKPWSKRSERSGIAHKSVFVNAVPRHQSVDPDVLCHEEQLQFQVVGNFQSNQAARRQRP